MINPDLTPWPMYTHARVHRYHTTGDPVVQNLADHQWGVATLCIWLANGVPSARLLQAALTHDLAESATGDVPAQVKKNPAVKEAFDALEDAYNNFYLRCSPTEALCSEDRMVLAIADKLELLFWCNWRVLHGCRPAFVIAHRGWEFLVEYCVAENVPTHLRDRIRLAVRMLPSCGLPETHLKD